MPENYLEENRFLYIESKLGPNKLLLHSFTGSEGISQLFSYQLELLSESREIKFEDILGQEISFGVAGPDGNDQPRHIHGIVTAFSQLPSTSPLFCYRAVVSPKLWILTRKQYCRIFQKLTTPDILKKVFADMNVVWELQGSYTPRDYCVQYRETDFNFASRLMEEEGIFYFFRHAKNAHKLVIADNKSSHLDIPGESSLIYDETSGGTREEARVSSWMKTQELGSGMISLQDYFYETSQKKLSVSNSLRDKIQVGNVAHKLKVGGNDQFEIYDYPGGYEKKPQGDGIARHSMELLEMCQFTIRGESNSFSMIPGYKFALKRHPHAEGPYVITSVTHSASEGSFYPGDQTKGSSYTNAFTVIPQDAPYRPRLSAEKPHVQGCQTAVVVGPAGEEIYTDKYGRVKVQFHWDREGRNNDSSSCWIRFATHWGGSQWGSIHIPRVGQEVVVDFLEGNPDRPIIVGSVYNDAHMPPFDLPANKTQSGIKSQSSKGGGGYNQISFEDLKGSEEIIVHAQKDLTMKVENDRSITILHDDKANIKNNRETEVGMDYETKVGKKRKITAGSEIILETGKAKIEMKASGEITITGLNVTVEAQVGATIKGTATAEVSASGQTTIKGAMVMIN